MARLSIPFNISILNLSPDYFRNLPKITDLSIFDSTKESFHPDGLFSNTLFGPVGSEIRNKRFGYIDIKLPILHPIIYKSLTQARKFYQEIMSGETYAQFSYKENDFIKSDPIEGETGFNFFMTYYKLLELKDTNTERRREAIQLLNKYKERAIIDKIIVLPAGLRDVEFEDNRPTYDDINDHYKKLISLTNNISDTIVELDPSLVDSTRFRIQETFNLLYENLLERIDGKKKLFLGKWASRRIFNGTRNVITAVSPSGRYLDDESNIGYNDTVTGLYQMMKSILPVAVFNIQNSILNEIFLDPNAKANLINKDTLKLEEVDINSKIFDYFQSQEGIERLISDYQHEEMKHLPIMVNDHYVCLTYSDDKYFKIFRNIEDLPLEYSKDNVHPTTYTELFYSCLFDKFRNYYNILVRYPISGTGSTVPSTTMVITTNNSKKLEELDDNWSPNGRIAVSWPILGEKTHESLGPAVSALKSIGGDNLSKNLNLSYCPLSQ